MMPYSHRFAPKRPALPLKAAALSGAMLIGAAALPALASPVDLMPLERPGTHAIEQPLLEGSQPTDMQPDTRSALPPAPAPAPVPARAAPAPAPAQTAPAAPEPAITRIAFEPDEAALDEPALTRLKSFAQDFKSRTGRVELRAYAGSFGEQSSTARRIALKRVLAVREVLLAQGIAAERLDVRALGGARDSGPPDRVDIVYASR
jgi:outer membrane protein OmpA-like peptidoglycan-associated protein